MWGLVEKRRAISVKSLMETFLQQIDECWLSGRVGEVLRQPGIHACFPFPVSGVLQEVFYVFWVMQTGWEFSFIFGVVPVHHVPDW